MDRHKNRDQEIAPTGIGYRDFVVSCGSGLLTAIVGIIEDRDQEISHKVMEPTVLDRKIAPSGRFYSTSHD